MSDLRKKIEELAAEFMAKHNRLEMVAESSATQKYDLGRSHAWEVATAKLRYALAETEEPDRNSQAEELLAKALRLLEDLASGSFYKSSIGLDPGVHGKECEYGVRDLINEIHDFMDEPPKPMTDAEKLRALADWLDRYDCKLGIIIEDREVQADLRRIAEGLERLEKGK